MPKTIVVCADGTCNAFGYASSNVARLLGLIELHQRHQQVAIYDQGIGTTLTQYSRMKTFARSLGDTGTLHPLEPPDDAWSRPWTWPFLIASMVGGLGLKANVRQLYVELAQLYSPGDLVFMFGFSRGAFTVRALAGLTCRYGLPSKPDRAGARFADAWPLFIREFPDPDHHNADKARRFFDNGGRECPIYFLGLWDTVKSYGGLLPRMLPHLRHNPSVTNVRHAMSLNEQRGWFEVTTWGWLDSDRKRKAAISRLSAADIKAIGAQNVLEVWFTGCHADIGGGGLSDDSSSIALRWMLAEARCFGLELNARGRWFLTLPKECEEPSIEDSRSLTWKSIDAFPRLGIKNDAAWPRHVYARGRSPRQPGDSARGGKVFYHESVRDLAVFKDLPRGVTLHCQPTLPG